MLVEFASVPRRWQCQSDTQVWMHEAIAWAFHSAAGACEHNSRSARFCCPREQPCSQRATTAFYSCLQAT